MKNKDAFSTSTDPTQLKHGCVYFHLKSENTGFVW